MLVAAAVFGIVRRDDVPDSLYQVAQHQLRCLQLCRLLSGFPLFQIQAVNPEKTLLKEKPPSRRPSLKTLPIRDMGLNPGMHTAPGFHYARSRPLGVTGHVAIKRCNPKPERRDINAQVCAR